VVGGDRSGHVLHNERIVDPRTPPRTLEIASDNSERNIKPRTADYPSCEECPDRV